MGLLKELNLSEYRMSNEEMERSLEYKLNKLRITKEQVDLIKEKPYKTKFLGKDKITNSFDVKVINSDDLVGMCRVDVNRYNNWIEALDELQKMINFNRPLAKLT